MRRGSSLPRAVGPGASPLPDCVRQGLGFDSPILQHSRIRSRCCPRSSSSYTSTNRQIIRVSKSLPRRPEASSVSVTSILSARANQGQLGFDSWVSDEDDDEDNVMAATVQELPSRSLDGLWERSVHVTDRARCRPHLTRTASKQPDLHRRHQTSPTKLHLYHPPLLGRRRGFQHNHLESGRTPSRPPRDGQDLALPCARSETGHPAIGTVRSGQIGRDQLAQLVLEMVFGIGQVGAKAVC